MRVAAVGAGLTQYWRDVARDARAFTRERERAGLRVRDSERDLCVTCAQMESFQNPLCFGWCGDSCPRCEGKLQTGALTGLNGNFY